MTKNIELIKKITDSQKVVTLYSNLLQENRKLSASVTVLEETNKNLKKLVDDWQKLFELQNNELRQLEMENMELKRGLR